MNVNSTKHNKPRAIILITLDALRADHVGCYGYPLPTTPTLDRLWRESVFFEHAFSTISLTAPSITSVLTGRYPRFHSIGFHNGDKSLIKEQETTLPIILRDLGYQTAAFVSIWPLRKQTGLDLGWDLYDDNFTHGELNRPSELRRSADQTISAILGWIGEHKESPFFIFAHFCEPHGPYTPPSPYSSLFVGHELYGPPLSLEASTEDSAERGIPAYQVLKPKRSADGRLEDYERDYRYYVSQYDGNISFVDFNLSVLFRKLRDWNIYDDALVIVTADHGESFGENNIYFQHSLTVSLDQIRVPLFVKPPTRSGFKPMAVDAPVSTVDIMPTVLGIAGVGRQYLGIQGLNLLPFLAACAPWPKRYIFSEIPSQLSVVADGFQLLCGKSKQASERIHPNYPYSTATDGIHLYDYVADVRGVRDISKSHPDVIKKLLDVSERYLKMPLPSYQKARMNKLSEQETADIKERLKQLGYVSVLENTQTIEEETIDARLRQVETQLRQVETQLRQVYASVSWRMTAPLRKAFALIVRK
jgi:arylsulfatase